MSDNVAAASTEATVWVAEVTEKGKALLAKLAEGDILEITRAQSGSGAVDISLLKQQTAVATPQQTATIQPVAYPEAKKVKLPITIRNDGLAYSYTATNIGAFANDPDEGEILFFLAVADGPGTSIVSEALQPGYSADFDFYVSFGNADSVNVTVDPSNSVTQEGLENYVATQMATLTPDSEKHVAYAQRAGTADKTQSALTIRVNGGRTEGSDMWTFDGSTGRTANITIEKLGGAPAVESTDYPGCYYRTVDGVTEWINPPMVAGTIVAPVEYRTTERFLGVPVYTKAVKVALATPADDGTITQTVASGSVAGFLRGAVYVGHNTFLTSGWAVDALEAKFRCQGGTLKAIFENPFANVTAGSTIIVQAWYIKDDVSSWFAALPAE